MNTYSLNTLGARTDQAMARNMKLLAHHELEGFGYGLLGQRKDHPDCPFAQASGDGQGGRYHQ